MKQNRNIALLLWSCLFVIPLWAQHPEPITSEEPDHDTTYIWDRRDQLHTSLFLENKSHFIFFNPVTTNDLLLRTNNAILNPGIQATYGWLNVRAKVPMDSWQLNTESRGPTTNYAVAVGITGRHWWARTYYEYNKGYFAEDIIYKGTLFKLPQLRTHQFNINGYYAFNGEKYSHRHTLWQSEDQLKSAGTFLVGGSFSSEWIYNDSVLIPLSYHGNFGTIEDVRDIYFLTPAVHGGYAYTYVPFPGWSITAYLAPGIGAYFGQYKNVDNEYINIDNSFALLGEFNGLIAYSARTWYANISASQYGSYKILPRESSWMNVQSYIRFGFGYRFNVPDKKLLEPVKLQ
jgi:hypothetical protein